jgi:recombination protein RecT
MSANPPPQSQQRGGPPPRGQNVQVPRGGAGAGNSGGGNGNGALTVKDFRTTIEALKGQLANALPKHIKADRLIRIILTTVNKTPDLLACTQTSLLGAILQCAQLGLEPDGVLGQAYLIPFRNRGQLECQLVPGYKGLIKLAYQSGEVGAIRARVVRQRDDFHYSYGLNEVLIHTPHRGPDPGPMVAVYAVAKIRGVDEPQFVVLERWEVEEIRDRYSKGADRETSPWRTNFEEMAKKTSLRRLCKMLPASVEKDNLARAVALDEQAENGLPQDFSYIDVNPIGEGGPQQGQAQQDDPGPGKPSTLSEAADRAKAARAEERLDIEVPPAGDPLPIDHNVQPEPGSQG